MRWITREFAKVDRIACPWLIRRFIDPDAKFILLPTQTDWNATTVRVLSGSRREDGDTVNVAL
jgi:hypothetical protein